MLLNQRLTMAASDDQYFLLYFITGTFFGPDMKEERPHKSIFQREAEGLPKYTLDQLAGSYMKTEEVERVYYYVLRKVEKSLSVKLHLLHCFFDGSMTSTLENHPPAGYPQFPDVFSPELHPHSELRNGSRIIENIVFINDPNISHVKPDELERFKRLTGLDNLVLDWAAVILRTSEDNITSNFDYMLVPDLTFGGSEDLSTSYIDHMPVDRLEPEELPGPIFGGDYKSTTFDMPVEMVKLIAQLPDPADHTSGGTSTSNRPIGRLPAPKPLRAPKGKSPFVGQKVLDVTPLRSVPPRQRKMDEEKKVGPPIIIMAPSSPKKQDWDGLRGIGRDVLFLSGSATTGQMGPSIGNLNIDESDDSYMFRVALPGVKNDDDSFSCSVEGDGRVHIKGVRVTGEETVTLGSRTFVMRSQNLGPPGEFSLTFHLPGPVNPLEFKGHFANGMLEGLVEKLKPENIVVDDNVSEV